MGNESHDKQEEAQRPGERQPEHTKQAQSEANAGSQNYADQVKAYRQEQKISGKSKATGAGADAYGKGGLASAKDLLGEDAHGISKKEKQTALLAQIEKDGFIVGKPKDKQSAPEYGQGSDGRWHFQNPRVKPGQDIAGELKEWLWNDASKDISELPGNLVKGSENVAWNATVAVAEAINRQFGTNYIPEGATMDYLSGITKNPEKYEQAFREISPSACNQAYKAFGLDKLGADPTLIPGLIWNEQLHLKPSDQVQDIRAGLGVKLSPTESIGPAQMQIRNIQHLADEYPLLRQFGDPVKAALDPNKAPYFVAAYLCDEAKAINDYNHKHPNETPISVNSDSLAYRYNPDVYRDPQGKYRSLEPWEKLNIQSLHGFRKMDFPVAGIVENSHHVSKVKQAMQEVRKASR